MYIDTRTKKVTVFFDGAHWNMTALAKKYGIVPSTFRRRLDRGLPIHEALGL